MKIDWEKTTAVCNDCGYKKFENKKTKRVACLNCEIATDFQPDFEEGPAEPSTYEVRLELDEDIRERDQLDFFERERNKDF